MFIANEYIQRSVESDGRTVNQNRDSPGQRSLYIPPGNPNRESYRLSTFKDYPSSIPINTCQLAARGFYFTGYKDRVKCFSCGQATENWILNDDIWSREWHKPDCDFINGRDIGNIPIDSFFQTSNYRETSTYSSNQLASTSADNTRLGTTEQLYTSSSLHRTQGTSLATSHQLQSTSSTPTTFRGNEAAHSVPQSTENEAFSSNQNLTNTFPCLYPINPHMRNEASRLQTFLDFHHQWPAYRINATIEELAAAGMYYLGERDRVKCWYCNGGLQNWERNDVPWIEHAKWFPMCEFLLQQKGPDFVHEVIAQYPNLRRPTLYNPAEVTLAISSSQTIPSTSRGPPFSAQSTKLPVIVDTREELQKKVNHEMSSSKLVSKAKLMGFEDSVIQKAIKRQYEIHDEGFSTLASLVEAILSSDETYEREPQSSSASNFSTNESTASSSRGEREVTQLEEARNCKKCRKERACIVLIPCGHLAFCVECGKNIKKCPICNSLVRETIRSYIV